MGVLLSNTQGTCLLVLKVLDEDDRHRYMHIGHKKQKRLLRRLVLSQDPSGETLGLKATEVRLVVLTAGLTAKATSLLTVGCHLETAHQRVTVTPVSFGQSAQALTTCTCTISKSHAFRLVACHKDT